MNKAQFWRLIEEAKAKSGGECEAQMETLQQSLENLPPEEIIAFDKIYDELRYDAYRYDLWGAAYLINGGCSDDGFEYFRGWLITQGEAIYNTALQNPDSLADVIEADFSDGECEDMLYVGGHAYKKKTGQEMPMYERETGNREPVGEHWEEDDLDAVYPKIVAKIGV